MNAISTMKRMIGVINPQIGHKLIIKLQKLRGNLIKYVDTDKLSYHYFLTYS